MKLRKLLMIILPLILIIQAGCESSPVVEENPDPEPYLVIDPVRAPFTPMVVRIDEDWVKFYDDDLKELVMFQIDVYSDYLKLLLSAESTGLFIDPDIEIQYIRDVIQWLEELSGQVNSENQ